MIDSHKFSLVRKQFNKEMEREIVLTGNHSYTIMNDLLEEYFRDKMAKEVKRMKGKHDRRLKDRLKDRET